jgi:hypothetical protein
MTWLHPFPFLLNVQLDRCTQRHGCNLSRCCGMGSMLLEVGGNRTLTKFPFLSLIMPSLGSHIISQGPRISPSWSKVCISWKNVNKKITHGNKRSNWMHHEHYLPTMSTHVHLRHHGVHTFLFLFPTIPITYKVFQKLK